MRTQNKCFSCFSLVCVFFLIWTNNIQKKTQWRIHDGAISCMKNMRQPHGFHWWLVRLTLVVAFVFLPQNFGGLDKKKYFVKFHQVARWWECQGLCSRVLHTHCLRVQKVYTNYQTFIAFSLIFLIFHELV